MKTSRIIQLIEDSQPKDIEAIKDYVLGLTALEAVSRRKQFELVTMAEYTEAAKKRNATWNVPLGITTGIVEIDHMTMGFAPGEMTVLGGATSNGKTMLAVNLAVRIALAGVPVLFVTMEMTHAELTSRFMRIAGDDYDRIAGLVTYQRDDELNWQSVDGLMEQAVKQAGAGIVIIDHLHYFSRDVQNVAEDLGRVTKEFKKNAIRHNIPVILLSHTRKTAVGSRNNTTIDDLRGSSYIGQDADIVLMVKRENDAMIVTLEKNRNRLHTAVGESRSLAFNSSTLELSSTYEDVSNFFGQ
jgi:replicative DNA helicase